MSLKLQQDRTLEDRKRNILVLIVDYLTRNGYLDSSQRLQSEAGLISKNLEVLRVAICAASVGPFIVRIMSFLTHPVWNMAWEFADTRWRTILT